MEATAKTLQQFSLRITALAIFLAIVSVLIFKYLLTEYYFSAFPALFIFVYLTTLIIHIIIVQANKKRQQVFTNRFMVATTLKLFLYVIVLATFLFLQKETAVPFSISFIALYFVFTTFEVIEVLKFIKKNKNTIENK